MNLRLTLTLVVAALALGACNTTKTDQRTGDNSTATTPTTTTTTAPQPAAGSSVGTVTSVTAADASMAADFAWTDASGSHKLSDYRGRVVLINFWGTWCPPCRRELPSLVKIREDLGQDKFEIIGINIGEQPRGGTVESHVASFASSNNIRWPLVIGDEAIVNAYGGIEVVPTTFLVDADGRIVEKITGSRDEAAFRSLIQKAM